MPTVEFDIDELNEGIGKKLSEKELREIVPMIGVGLESIADGKLIIEVFPNRPDMLSIEGFTHAFRGFLGIETGMKELTVRNSDVKLFVDSSVKNVRPFVVAGMIKNVEIDNKKLISIMNVQEKLHLTHGQNRKKVAIGVHDMDKVNAPFFYKAVKPEAVSFVPLDMSKELNLKQILQQHPKGRDYAYTLEGFEKYPVIVDGKNNVLSFPPIINGELTRVTEETRNLFMELTGTNQHALEIALNIVVSSIADSKVDVYSVEIIKK